MQNNFITVTGCVISQAPSGEFDRRVVILTRELGTISCFAKGARRPKGKLTAATRAFIFGRFKLYAGRNAYNLNDAEIIKAFDKAAKDVEAVLYLNYLGELASRLAVEGTDGTDYINILYYAVYALLDSRLDKRITRAAFELRAAYIFGELLENASESFKGRPISAPVRAAVNYVCRAKPVEMYSFSLAPPAKEEFAALAENVIKSLNVGKFKSKEILENIEKNISDKSL